MASSHTHALLGAVEPGTVVEHWTVKGEAAPKFGIRHLRCRCICGKERDVSIGSLRVGISKSCGCQTKKRTHGMYLRSENSIFRKMIYRCHNPRAREYKNYGGRGIQVCQEWRDNFLSFYEHIGPRPSMDYTVDRINNDGNYEPGNVRWATRKQQAANTRETFQMRSERGRRQAIARWSRRKAS